MYVNMKLPIDEEGIHCFIRGLGTQLWVEFYYFVIAGHSFLLIVDHAHSIETFYSKAKEGIDKMAQHEGSYMIYSVLIVFLMHFLKSCVFSRLFCIRIYVYCSIFVENQLGRSRERQLNFCKSGHPWK